MALPFPRRIEPLERRIDGLATPSIHCDGALGMERADRSRCGQLGLASADAIIPSMNTSRVSVLVLASTLIALSACRGAPNSNVDRDPGAAGDEQAAPGGTSGEPDRAPEGDPSGGGSGVPTDELWARLRAAPPGRDPLDIALRYGRIDAPPDFATPAAPPARELGETETFWLHDINAGRYFEIEARLEAMREHAYFWVQTDQRFDPEALERGADGFDQTVYPKVRAAFGSEWSPGIDGDPRVHVLHHQPVAGIAGYFYSVDEQPRAVEPHSNQREMFYINLSVYTPGSYDYLALLAHELQHMIHWHSDPNEAVWANEGLSELSAELAGYRAQNGSNFLSRPDTPLLEWEADSGANAANYAASYAFMAYLHARFGLEAIRAFVEADADGAAGVEAALAEIGQPMTFDEIFLDWAIANALPPDVRRGRDAFDYGASDLSRADWSDWPAEGRAETVRQYGTDYFDVTSAVENGRLRLDFAGETRVGLLDPLPAGSEDAVTSPSGQDGSDPPFGEDVSASSDPANAGDLVWWSQRGDNIASRLTLPVDLGGLDAPTLRFEAWQAIEQDWDYAYLSLSTDEGDSWQRLAFEDSRDANPNGNNLGAGLTGSRGWRTERVDLSEHAGQEVWLRWELVTDDAVNLEGLALAEVALESGGETRAIDVGDAAWQAEGWQRVPLTLPQRWGLQLLIFGSEGLQIWRPEADAEGLATFEAADIPDDATVVAAISGLTPATRQPAGYRLMPADAAGDTIGTAYP